MRHRVLAALVFVSVLALAGCTAVTAPAPGELTSDWNTPLAPLWTEEGDTVGWPHVVDDIVLSFMTTDAGGEALSAWRASTGERLWSIDTSLGGMDGDWFHYVATLDGDDGLRVAVLTSDDVDGALRLAVIDAETGAAVVSAAAPEGAARPYRCDETFCVSVTTRNNTYDIYSLTGDVLAPRSAESGDEPYVTPGSYAQGTYVFTAGGPGPGQVLQYARDGRVWWTRGLQDVFGPDTWSGYGHEWWDEADQSVIVGWNRAFAGGVDLFEPGTFEGDLASGQRMVGLDPSTGATIWSAVGLRPCGPGRWAPSDDPTLLIVCSVSAGSMSLSWSGQEQSVPIDESGTEQSLVALDRVTGVTRWSVPLDETPDGVERLEQGDDAVVATGGGIAEVDTATGEVTALPADAKVLCFIDAPLTIGGEEYSDWSRALCDAGGALDDSDVSRAALDVAGYPHGYVALNIGGGLAVYDLGDPKGRTRPGS